MNIPHLTQRFSENQGVFTPYPGGRAVITKIFDDGTVEINERMKLFVLPDGRLINHRLTPFPRYRQVIDYFVHDKTGTVIITGKYPMFWTSTTGDRVWLDADGFMKPFDPGPIEDRVQLKNRMAKNDRFQRKAHCLPLAFECLYCGTSFKPVRRTSKYCSEKCRYGFHNAKRPDRYEES